MFRLNLPAEQSAVKNSSRAELHVGVFEAVDVRVKRIPLDADRLVRKIRPRLVDAVQVGLEACVKPPACLPARPAVLIHTHVVVSARSGEFLASVEIQAVT